MKMDFKNHFFNILVVAVCCLIIGLVGCTASCRFKNSLTDTCEMHVKDAKFQHALLDSMQKDTLVKVQKYAQQMDTLFQHWDSLIQVEHNNLVQAQKSADQNLSIWLAVIAAICTILPVVLGINQTSSFDAKLDIYKQYVDGKVKEFENQLDKEIKGSKNDIVSAKQEFNNHIAETKDKLDAEVEKMQSNMAEYHKEMSNIRLMSFLNIFCQNIRMLRDLQDLEIRENTHLTCPELVRNSINSIAQNAKECKDRFEQDKETWKDEDTIIIFRAQLSSLCSIRDLAYEYENLFTGMNLLRLQRLKDILSFYLKEKAKLMLEAKLKDVEDAMSRIVESSSSLKSLFDELLKEE